MAQAEDRLREYTERLTAARLSAKAVLDQSLEQAKKEEADIFSNARNEAKKITQEASAAIEKQAEVLRAELKNEVDVMAKSVTEKLLLRKV